MVNTFVKNEQKENAVTHQDEKEDTKRWEHRIHSRQLQVSRKLEE
jgi:hypothetical protein